jgi:hypothetical protein
MPNFKFAAALAISLFIIGTGILIWFYLNPSSFVAFVAYQFTILAIIVNWIYAGVLLFNFLKARISIPVLLKSLGVTVLNIPVGILYAYIMVWLLSYARITFKNSTGTDLGVIRIEGCQEKEITDLKNDDSRTVWIKIPGDCAIAIAYELNGEQRRETVIGYLVPEGGIKATYELKKEVRIKE